MSKFLNYAAGGGIALIFGGVLAYSLADNNVSEINDDTRAAITEGSEALQAWASERLAEQEAQMAEAETEEAAEEDMSVAQTGETEAPAQDDSTAEAATVEEPATEGEAIAEAEPAEETAADQDQMAAAGPDPELVAAGERVFRQCQACHQVGEEAQNRVGPKLVNVVGGPIAAVEDFKYSNVLAEAGAAGDVWNRANLTAFLANPRESYAGTKMSFRGLNDEADIEAVMAYLAAEGGGGFEDANAGAAAGEAETQEASTSTAPGDQDVTEAATTPEPEDEGQETASADAAAEASANGSGMRAVALAPDFETTSSQGPMGLGRVATEAEIAAWNIDVRFDGQGLPDGSGSVADGEVIYQEQCSVCHGTFGEGIGRWPVLAGGEGTLAAARPVKTVGSYWPYLSTVYDYVHRAMPFGNAQSLSDDDVYAVTAYLLNLNFLVDDDFVLSSDNFAEVGELPNEGAFYLDDREETELPEFVRTDVCMENCKDDVEITKRAAVLDVTPEGDGN